MGSRAKEDLFGWFALGSQDICNKCYIAFLLRIWPCKFTLYLQITLSTVLRRKKKCIRYLQGEGRCSSPVSSDGSAIDSPSSPLDVLQCISPALTSDKLNAPADSVHQDQANSFLLPAHIKSAMSTHGFSSKCSATPRLSIAPREPSTHSVVSIGT